MICPYCNKDFSPKVWRIHKNRCSESLKIDSEQPLDKSDLSINELRAIASKQGITGVARMRKADLIKAVK